MSCQSFGPAGWYLTKARVAKPSALLQLTQSGYHRVGKQVCCEQTSLVGQLAQLDGI